MPPPSYDYALLGFATFDLLQLSRSIDRLREEIGADCIQSLELHGRKQTGELVVQFRFPFALYSAALRSVMSSEAERHRLKLLEMALLPVPDRDRFVERLKGFDVKVETSGDLKAGVASFREKMGFGGAGSEKPLINLNFDAAEDIATAYARSVAQGKLFIPMARPASVGAELRLQFGAPSIEPLLAVGKVLERGRGSPSGVWVSVEASPSMREFLTRHARSRRQGRPSPQIARRAHERYDSCLTVEFRNFPEFIAEYGANISRGGLFVKTYAPPPPRSRVKVALSLPNDEEVEVEAEVVHVVTADVAKSRGITPGVGLSFVAPGAEFTQRVDALIAEYRARPARLLLVHPDAEVRARLKAALEQESLVVDAADDGNEGIERLTEQLFELDLLILGIPAPVVDERSFLWRIRKVGGELDLRIVLLSPSLVPGDLVALKGPSGASEVIPSDTELPKMVATIKRLLGR